MPLLHLVVLALVQGITEFLPISSSAHLILVPKLTGWEDQGLLLDVATHVGTLCAVLLYFHREVWRIVADLLPGRHSARAAGGGEGWPTLVAASGASPTGGTPTSGVAACEASSHLRLDLREAPGEAARARSGATVARRPTGADAGGRRLAGLILVATIPTVIAGALVSAFVADLLRSVTVIGWATLLFGVVLYVADRWFPATRREDDLSYAEALVIGLFQAVALIPGTSRSGVTMTAGRLLGLDRQAAARFSMLLAIPTIVAAGALAGGELWTAGDASLTADALLAGALAFVSALVTIAVLMRLLERISFTPFVLYRIALGAALLLWAYT